MRIHDPRRFGQYLMECRKRAGLPLRGVAEKLGLHPKLYGALEGGLIGTDVDDDMVEALMELIPEFRIATAPGVSLPSVPVKATRQEGVPVYRAGRFVGMDDSDRKVPRKPR